MSIPVEVRTYTYKPKTSYFIDFGENHKLRSIKYRYVHLTQGWISNWAVQNSYVVIKSTRHNSDTQSWSLIKHPTLDIKILDSNSLDIFWWMFLASTKVSDESLIFNESKTTYYSGFV